MDSNILDFDQDLFPKSPNRTVICPPKGKTVARILQSCTEYLSCNDGIGTRVKCPFHQEYSDYEKKCVSMKKADCEIQSPKIKKFVKCRYKPSDNKPLYLPSNNCDRFYRCSGFENEGKVLNNF